MYTKSSTKKVEEQENFKKKVLASKPAAKGPSSKTSLNNIVPSQTNLNTKDQNKNNNNKNANNNADNKNANNQSKGDQQRKDSLDNKNKKEKKKRIVYVDENSDDTEEEIVVVKRKKEKRNESLDDKQRGRSPRNNSIDGKNQKGKEVDAKLNKDKIKMRTRSQPSMKPKKKVEEKKPEVIKKPKDPYILVTEFYLGQYKAPICGADIFEMFNWKGQYAHLDINHAYFHWLFPHFQGPFGKERAILFRQNAVIGKRIIQSYELILDFYGIKLDDEATGQVSRLENYLERYKETFLRPYTNHEFRVKRMLQFLNVTGYRIYAVQLVKFLEKEVYKFGKNFVPPLKSLELIFQTEWKPYGEIDEKDKKALESVAQKCLFSFDVLTQEINSHLKTLL
ncbi:opioid growth factor receptor (macronuclear) [Tetrahymena thermophila SB210]|uniref:Opioid growth factor receptor n=1 Tax=Tetrahymena thermophila (strain SB210) TaxID=312017 RepID=Q22KP8_TETTS|nr:opioid growth factor receptor [Tetrahymena thermophila SB210]EAR85751.1 opioid growth factor receptor [Tetrahymena thermophila SB210]|eukprot:XP_001033414.1 opioid growth factor receptor [Tetrahymena thermophila SB210]